MNITAAQLARIAPHASPARRDFFLEALNRGFQEFKLDTPNRKAAFLAQVLHESGEFKWLEEIWGNTPAQRRYEGRRDLGNTHPGDGYRFRGRGLSQLTGRANYRSAGQALGLPLETNPDIAAEATPSVRIALWFWNSRRPFVLRYLRRMNFNELANRGHIDVISRVWNGARTNAQTNGLEQRRNYYNLAKSVLTP